MPPASDAAAHHDHAGDHAAVVAVGINQLVNYRRLIGLFAFFTARSTSPRSVTTFFIGGFSNFDALARRRTDDAAAHHRGVHGVVLKL
jgi:hypothetical protein